MEFVAAHQEMLNRAVFVELHNGKHFEGVLNSANEVCIDVSFELNKKKKAKFFYWSEIRSIKPLEIDDCCETTNETTSSEDIALTISHINNTSPAEIKQIEKNITHFVEIKQHDSDYFDAVKDLQKEELIGVGCEGIPFGRLTAPHPLLILSTAAKVYVFDMMMLQKMKNELRALFKAKVPRKVVHNSRMLSDYLKHIQNCQLNGVIDTQVVHCIIQKRQENANIHQLLEIYLDLPQKHEVAVNWHIRQQITKDAKEFAVYKVAYLIKLYFRMVHDYLFRKVVEVCDDFSQHFAQNDDLVDAMAEMSMGSDDVNVDMNVLNELLG